MTSDLFTSIHGARGVHLGLRVRAPGRPERRLRRQATCSCSSARSPTTPPISTPTATTATASTGAWCSAPRSAAGSCTSAARRTYRDLNDAAPTVRYRARPFVHTTDVRLVDTGDIHRHRRAQLRRRARLRPRAVPRHGRRPPDDRAAPRPRRSDLLGRLCRGRHAADAAATRPPTGAAPTTASGRPTRSPKAASARSSSTPATTGSTSTTARSSAASQEALGLSAIWMPTDYVRFLVNYGHLWIDDAAVPGGPGHRLPGRYDGRPRPGRFLSRGAQIARDVTALCRESVISP